MNEFLKSLGLLLWFTFGLQLTLLAHEGDYGLWEVLMYLPLLLLMSWVFDNSILRKRDRR